MSTIAYREGERLEYKREWTERALQDIAAFANTRGGKVMVGVEDDGTVVGCDTSDEQVQRITNQIEDLLGIGLSVDALSVEGQEVLEIAVHQAPSLVSLKGRYYGRMGSRNRQLSSEELAHRSLSLVGKTWDSLPSDARPEDLDGEAVVRFAELAHDRYPKLDGDADPTTVVDNLGLLHDGHVTNAGVLMFAKRIERFIPRAQYQIGKLETDSDDIVDLRLRVGNILELLDKIDEDWHHFLERRSVITGEGRGAKAAQRTEVWEYPRIALREAFMNAIVHRDYTIPGYLKIVVMDDRLEIWNPGGLPGGLELELLRATPHPSRPRNEMLAQLCHYAGLIERYGTGTTRMIKVCREQGLPEPGFEETGGGFSVLFAQDLNTPERWREEGLTEELIHILSAAKGEGAISNERVQELLGVAKRTATRKLKSLVESGHLVREGTTGRGTSYTLPA